MKINGVDIYENVPLPQLTPIRLWGPICADEPDGPHARMAETPFGAWVLYEEVKGWLPASLQHNQCNADNGEAPK